MAYGAAPIVKLKESSTEVSKFRNFFIRIVNHRWFESFIIYSILANSTVLACQWYGMPVELVKAFDVINYVFMAIFTVEAVVKLIALKVSNYFKDGWNIFDFAVVVINVVVLILQQFGTGD
jgi:hypothetical protein